MQIQSLSDNEGKGTTNIVKEFGWISTENTSQLDSENAYTDVNPNEEDSDNYDITMDFDPTILGATVEHISEDKSCSISHFSVGNEFINCQSCVHPSIGHKLCFSQDLITSHYYCALLHSERCFLILQG